MDIKTILIVEDELLFAKNLAQKLQKLGYKVIKIVSSGEGAIKQITKDKPDLILMDIAIKGHLNGIETAKTIQETYHIPVIYLTAYGDDDTLNKVFETQAYGYIIKPFKDQELKAILQIAFKQYEYNQKLEKQATTDPLTGVFNRRQFFDLAEKEIARSLRYHEPFSLLMIDIDHFKKINDTYGHSIGDEIIKNVAKTIFNNLREVDLIGRFGGEEFIIILSKTELKDAVLVAERLRLKIESSSIKSADQIIKCTVSIGIGTYQENDQNIIDIINRADECLYCAKNQGRNQVNFPNN